MSCAILFHHKSTQAQEEAADKDARYRPKYAIKPREESGNCLAMGYDGNRDSHHPAPDLVSAALGNEVTSQKRHPIPMANGKARSQVSS